MTETSSTHAIAQPVAEQSLRAMSAQSDVARATLGTLLRIHLTYL